ncbi:lectin [Takifugu flavidus]|uniref:Mannose-binding protein C n=1 Tax=Takifugu flavidus TaxID=433684 RepID=A0A5C6PQ57_9TELE|nr:lectin [Takifugu flavidus]TWW81026.1 Mannose-binding protein C [Takifugu flavidus]
MKTLTLLALSLAVALGMSPGKDEVPGPMVEDGPPAEGPVEEADPAPEDQQEIQTKGGHHCPGFSHDGRCYRFFRAPKTARNAEVFCQKLSAGGHLASITSQHLHRQVMRLILRANGAPTHVWVGGQRYLTTGRFVWLDGSSWIYADWRPGKPRPTSNVDNCVELLANGKFNDLRCSETEAFICSHPE